MLRMNSPANLLLYSTVRVVGKQAKGTSTGTAFFMMFSSNEAPHVPVLITNKHVIKGCSEGEICLHIGARDQNNQMNPTDESFWAKFTDFEQQWIMHPEDEIDLCAMPFGPIENQAKAVGKQVVYSSFTIDQFFEPKELEELTALEDVTMIGYPIGLWDHVNNFPLIRRGITASHPAINFQGLPIGVIDMACVPGSSGSPVLIFNEGSYSTPQGISLGSRLRVLGVLFGGPQQQVNGEIKIVNIPTAVTSIVQTMIPIHLGYYIHALEILKLREALFNKFNIK